MTAPTLAALVAPDRCAVLVQEMQMGVVGPDARLQDLARAADERGIVAKLAALLEGARATGVPIVHAVAALLPDGFGANGNARLFAAARRLGLDADGMGTGAARPLPELGTEEGDVVLPRYHGLSPLTGTQLDSLLRNEGVETVIVTGVSLNVAIPNVVFDAVNRSYQVVLVTDAVVGTPVDYGDAVIRNSLAYLATLATTEEVLAAWR